MIGKKNSGFTLVELLVVLLVVSILAGIVAPVVVKTLDSAKESALKENLYVMRKSLDDFYADNGRYPESLEELVAKGYLRFVPEDALTEQNDTWEIIRDDEGGVSDVHSGYGEAAKDGSDISEW